MSGDSSLYYPIFLNIRSKKCVVVGGGQVALRKVKALLEAGANVEVISPDLCSELNSMAEDGQITVQQKSFKPGDLDGAMITIAATDHNDINLEVAREARGKCVLFNAVDNAGNSDFIVPSCLRRGDITIAVSTSGRSPALARKIRTQLQDDLGDEYANLAVLVGEVRMKIKSQGIKVDGEDWQKALDLDLLVNLLKKGDRKRATNILLSNLKALQK